MENTVIAAVLHVLWIALLFGHRTWAHRRKTGDTGYRGLESGSVGAVVKLLFAVAVVGFVASPVLSPASGQLELGLGLYFTGLLVAAVAQAAMGRSWRIGVRDTEPTELVVRGPFRFVRNPIFSGMLVLLAGFVVMHPGWLSVSAWVATWLALYLQVRVVEEPYLARTLGEPYLRWALGRGRFFPG